MILFTNSRYSGAYLGSMGSPWMGVDGGSHMHLIGNIHMQWRRGRNGRNFVNTWSLIISRTGFSVMTNV